MENLITNWITAVKLMRERKITDTSLRIWVKRSREGGYYPPDLEAQDGIHYVMRVCKQVRGGFVYLFNRKTVTSKLVREIKEWGKMRQHICGQSHRKRFKLEMLPPLEPELRNRKIYCKAMDLKISMEHCRLCYLSKSEHERTRLNWEACRKQNEIKL